MRHLNAPNDDEWLAQANSVKYFMRALLTLPKKQQSKFIPSSRHKSKQSPDPRLQAISKARLEVRMTSKVLSFAVILSSICLATVEGSMVGAAILDEARFQSLRGFRHGRSLQFHEDPVLNIIFFLLIGAASSMAITFFICCVFCNACAPCRRGKS